MLKDKLTPLLYLANNWISRIGVLLVTSAGIFWLLLLPTYLGGHAANAYLGILLFLLIPVAFFAGLGLIPLGIVLKRRRGWAPTDLPALDWRNPELRKLTVFVGVVSFANLLIGSNLTYRAVEHMDSSQFCGATCHTVMKPEYMAYQVSPHSKVECVKCHIGPGASWFVQSKLSGAGQLVAVTLNSYERPIPTPVRNLRPARETCETCHWPDKYGSDRLRVVTHFSDEGEETKSVLLMHIGGGSEKGAGIHTVHVGKGISIRYAHTDESRQTIPWVEYRRDGESREFLSSKAKKEDIAGMMTREMDCMDCHNRPSHTFELPERALDRGMAAREIAPDLPLIRKVALEVLKKDYGTTEKAEAEIPAAIESFYKEKHPDVFAKRGAEVTRSARSVLGLWQRNVFPEMKVTWGTYPNNIGHNDFPGCFRCHDDDHKSAGGKAIGQDCNSCHELLAMEEKSPKILGDLGLVK
ncbi:MAG: NapC/NirT family cytochrome c [Bryobacteraceae bacterium]|nr:NapC/NirT family cytochrome c [Bryobacteraceae bacterium]